MTTARNAISNVPAWYSTKQMVFVLFNLRVETTLTQGVYACPPKNDLFVGRNDNRALR